MVTLEAYAGNMRAKEDLADALGDIGGDVPKATLSFGVAFSGTETEGIYKDADTALYELKRAGRKRATFYEVEKHI